MISKGFEEFCEAQGFLYHKNGSGQWGADRYWTFTKVENNDTVLFTIEYYPVRNQLKIKSKFHNYQGTPESLTHLYELLAAMRIKFIN